MRGAADSAPLSRLRRGAAPLFWAVAQELAAFAAAALPPPPPAAPGAGDLPAALSSEAIPVLAALIALAWCVVLPWTLLALCYWRAPHRLPQFVLNTSLGSRRLEVWKRRQQRGGSAPPGGAEAAAPAATSELFVAEEGLCSGDEDDADSGAGAVPCRRPGEPWDTEVGGRYSYRKLRLYISSASI